MAAGHAVHDAVTPRIATAGTTQDIAAGVGGFSRVTVYSVNTPVNSDNTSPDPGDQFAVADVQVCANGQGADLSQLFVEFDLDLNDGSEQQWQTDQIENPGITSDTQVQPNQCVRGFVPFQIPTGTAPTSVRFKPDLLHTYEWTLH